jgi:hypothetical protein
MYVIGATNNYIRNFIVFHNSFKNPVNPVYKSCKSCLKRFRHDVEIDHYFILDLNRSAAC